MWLQEKPEGGKETGAGDHTEPEGGREIGAGDHTAGGNNENNAFMMSV